MRGIVVVQLADGNTSLVGDFNRAIIARRMLISHCSTPLQLGGGQLAGWVAAHPVSALKSFTKAVSKSSSQIARHRRRLGFVSPARDVTLKDRCRRRRSTAHRRPGRRR